MHEYEKSFCYVYRNNPKYLKTVIISTIVVFLLCGFLFVSDRMGYDLKDLHYTEITAQKEKPILLPILGILCIICLVIAFIFGIILLVSEGWLMNHPQINKRITVFCFILLLASIPFISVSFTEPSHIVHLDQVGILDIEVHKGDFYTNCTLTHASLSAINEKNFTMVFVDTDYHNRFNHELQYLTGSAVCIKLFSMPNITQSITVPCRSTKIKRVAVYSDPVYFDHTVDSVGTFLIDSYFQVSV
ncbi:hypothetical protein PCE1_000796 [Barthelona sp. PCE]